MRTLDLCVAARIGDSTAHWIRPVGGFPFGQVLAIDVRWDEAGEQVVERWVVVDPD